MSDNVQKRVAVITGASKGIGLATSKEFLKKGFTVYGLSRSGATAEGVNPVKVDVTDYAALEKAYADIYKAEGRIDVLVNNA
ncbi:MAG: SDR family NAD(P)-dependent oxidoreductase, partial [Clostridia bacterium]|nr:SDR family NAD(P)-dependent oxidoreductase [Clostridia bacterium]